jgi:NTP pyrophosphatase (non-canonical NTP hydrolase)
MTETQDYISSTKGQTDVKQQVSDLAYLCHQLASDSGWWSDLLPPQRGTVAEKLLLIHSEVSEACEGYRKNLMDDHLAHRKMVEVELADALIRICDLAGAMGLDLGGAVAEKLAYNQQRHDHKPENRALAGGKSF